MQTVLKVLGPVILPGLIILIGIIGRNPVVWFLGAVGYFMAAHYLARAAGLGGLPQLGLQRHRRWGWALVLGFAVGSLLQIGRVVALWKLGALAIDGTDSLLRLLAWFPAVTMLYVAFSEEVMGRGWWFAAMPARVPVWAVCVLSSAWFAVLHVEKWSEPFWSLVEVFLVGMVLAVAYGASRSLWLVAGVHWGIDFWHRFLGADGTAGGTAYWLVTHRTESFGRLVYPLDLALSLMLLVVVYLFRNALPRNDSSADERGLPRTG